MMNTQLKPFRAFLTELTHLHDVLNKEGRELVENLLSKRVTVNIKVDQSALVIMRDGDKLRFFNKDAKAELDQIRRTGIDLYEKPINFLETRPWRNLPDGVKIFLENFSDKLPTIIQYTSKPKNDLIISYAKDQHGNVIPPNDPMLKRVADILEVSPPPILFDGKLSIEQRKALFDFVTLPPDERKTKYAGKNFIEFVLGLFAPPEHLRFLVADGWEGLVFYFDGKVSSAKVVDPGFTETILDKKEKGRQDKYADLVLQEFLNNVDDIAFPVIKALPHGTNSAQDYKAFLHDFTVEFVRKNRLRCDKKFAAYENEAGLNKVLRVTRSLIPANLTQLFDNVWWSEDIYRMALFMLRTKKTRATPGMSKAQKDALNAVVAALDDKGLSA